MDKALPAHQGSPGAGKRFSADDALVAAARLQCLPAGNGGHGHGQSGGGCPRSGRLLAALEAAQRGSGRSAEAVLHRGQDDRRGVVVLVLVVLMLELLYVSLDRWGGRRRRGGCYDDVIVVVVVTVGIVVTVMVVVIVIVVVMVVLVVLGRWRLAANLWSGGCVREERNGHDLHDAGQLGWLLLLTAGALY